MKSLFEQRYQTWVQHRHEKTAVQPSSTPLMILAVDPNYSLDVSDAHGLSAFDPNVLFDHPSFHEIVQLGIPAVSFMIQRQQQDHLLGHALYRVTRWRYHILREGPGPGQYVWSIAEFPDLRSTSGPPDSRVIWVRWWRDGRAMTDGRFEQLYGDLQRFSLQGNADLARDRTRRIIDLGVAVLPLLAREIHKGHSELIPILSVLTEGRVKDTATPAEGLQWWKENEQAWLLPFGELPPEN